MGNCEVIGDSDRKGAKYEVIGDSDRKGAK